jgi:hypothetical protein
MGVAKGEQEWSEAEEKAIVPLVHVLRSVGATWDHIRVELFRIANSEGSAFKRVPSQSKLEYMLLDHYDCVNLTEYNEKHKDSLRSALKGKAVNMALSGNVPMLIFCLKNLCGWSDNVQVVPDKEDAKNQIKLAYDPKAV